MSDLFRGWYQSALARCDKWSPAPCPCGKKMLMKVRKSLSRANRVKNMGAKVSPKKPQPETEKDRKRMEEQLDKQLDAYLTEGAKSVF